MTFRVIRESVGHTQEQLAEILEVDHNTVKGWETGRRPLVNASGRTLLGLRRKLQCLDAPADLVRHLDTAMDADLFIGQTLEETCDPSLLAEWVSTRTWNEFLVWGLEGTPPSVIRPHLQRVPQSSLPSVDRQRFFDTIRAQAEQALRVRTASPLLRRQIYFMATWDPSLQGHGWLADMETAELRRLPLRGGWSLDWPLLRSVSVARARQGDPSLLRDFIARHLADDTCEAANLNYWSYWVEEDSGTARTDAFMVQNLRGWQGGGLLSHLAKGLGEKLSYLDLLIHTICALVQRRPFLLMENLSLARELADKSRVILDGPSEISVQARSELENIHFTATMAVRSFRSDDV
jgi:transcriptional regulator with XRE-family HTH domain